MKSLIITTAVSYRPADIWPFLASAERCCPDAALIAIVHQRDLPVLAPGIGHLVAHSCCYGLRLDEWQRLRHGQQ